MTAAALGAAVALLAAGCGSPAAETPAASTAKGGDGELRVLIPLEPVGLNPNAVRQEGVLSVAPNLFNKLVALDTELRLQPDLAESWKVSDGGRTYTFALRPGVTWHDGRPFTSADVRWTFEQRPDRRTNPAATALGRIERIETPGEHTVVLRLREPWAPFVPVLAAEGTFILPRPVPGETRDPAQEPIGTGPFRFVEWVKGDHITLAANPHYFRRGPFVDRVTFRFEPDFGRGARLLLSGTADLFTGRPDLAGVLRLSRDPRLRVFTLPSSTRYYLGFNLRQPRLQDPRVRRAFNLGLDRRRLVSRALLGFGVPGFGFYTPAVSWAYDVEARVPDFDPAAAATLLDAAGVRPGPDGVRLRLRFLAPDLPPSPALVAEVQAQLAPLGIAIVPEIRPYEEWIRRTLDQHDFDLSFMSGSQGPDPENLSLRFGSHGYSQFMGYSNPELDAILAEGARTVDLPRRAVSYFRAQRILARDLPIAPLAEGMSLAVGRRGLRGLAQAEARGLVTGNDYSLVRLEARP
jgi:peptide/nickel transport system substrate-binding protein